MDNKEYLNEDKLNKVTGGRGITEPTIEETIPQIDDDALLEFQNGGINNPFKGSPCTYDDGQDEFGHPLYLCSDLANKGKKSDCANCKAR